MCHLPIVCEEKKIPYVYVPFRSDISAAIGIRRPALMVLIKKHDDYADLYDECEASIKEITAQFMAQNAWSKNPNEDNIHYKFKTYFFNHLDYIKE